MLFRWLARQWIHATAERVVSEAVSDTGEERPVAGDVAKEEEPLDEEVPCQLPGCQVVVICGDSVEAGGLRSMMQDVITTRCSRLLEHAGGVIGRRVVLVESGSGPQAARDATEDVIQMHNPPLVIAAGFATGLCSLLEHEHILLADPIQSPEGTQVRLGSSWDRDHVQAQPDLHLGPLLSHSETLTNPDEKKLLAEQQDVLAVDMESLTIAEICRQHGTACMVIRVITETLEEGFPSEVLGLAQQQTTSARLGALSRALFGRPSSMKDLWKLKQRAYKASDKLGRFLISLIDQLPVK